MRKSPGWSPTDMSTARRALNACIPRNSSAVVPAGPTRCHERPPFTVRSTVPQLPLAHATRAVPRLAARDDPIPRPDDAPAISPGTRATGLRPADGLPRGPRSRRHAEPQTEQDGVAQLSRKELLLMARSRGIEGSGAMSR